MVGGLRAGGRVAAATLLALGSLAPLNASLVVATPVVPAADTTTTCATTVGTATTDPVLAADAARAIAVGYTATDCLPDAALLAAAEARAAIPMATSTSTPTPVTPVGGPLGGSSSSGSVVVAAPTTTTTVPTTTETPTSTDTTTSGTTTSGTTTSGTTTSETTATQTTTTETTPAAPRPTNDPVNPDNTGQPGIPVTGAQVENFDGDLSAWSTYNGEGHAGNGRRSPSAMSVSNGILTITGDESGTTGGMAWQLGRAKYGRWEARVRSPIGDPTYNAVMLLWPDAENWPVGGEVDFMEISDDARQEVDFFLHYGANNSQDHGSVEINAAEWHDWAVEWTETAIVGYVDGREWYRNTDTSHFPPGSMHLTLQLDWFPDDESASVQRSTMQVDWVKYDPVAGSVEGTGGTGGTGDDTVGDDTVGDDTVGDDTVGPDTVGDADENGDTQRVTETVVDDENAEDETSDDQTSDDADANADVTATVESSVAGATTSATATATPTATG